MPVLCVHLATTGFSIDVSSAGVPLSASAQWIGACLYQRQHLALSAGLEVLYACHMSVVAGRAWAVFRKRHLLCSTVSHHPEVTAVFSLTTDLSEMEASPVMIRYCMLLRYCLLCRTNRYVTWRYYRLLRAINYTDVLFENCSRLSRKVRYISAAP